FNLADQHGVPIVMDTEMDPWHWPAQRERLVSLLKEAEHVYLSLCLDVLEAGTAPGVSAPAGRGLNVAVVDDFVRTVAQSGKCRLFDVAELNPSLDIDERTARVAARLIWTMVAEHPFA
ncbi:MAG TPA: formimidoylglutamase, partial [Armatimonadetes bacterium]|nr:formimidoylglutamase [Armatimonadota bacterium]